MANIKLIVPEYILFWGVSKYGIDNVLDQGNILTPIASFAFLNFFLCHFVSSVACAFIGFFLMYSSKRQRFARLPLLTTLFFAARLVFLFPMTPKWVGT